MAAILSRPQCDKIYEIWTKPQGNFLPPAHLWYGSSYKQQVPWHDLQSNIVVIVPTTYCYPDNDFEDMVVSI